MALLPHPGMPLKWHASSTSSTPRSPDALAFACPSGLLAGPAPVSLALDDGTAACLGMDAGPVCTHGGAGPCAGAEFLWSSAAVSRSGLRGARRRAATAAPCG